MNLISTMLGFIGRKIKNLENEVGKINSTLDDVSPAPKVIPIERGGTGCTTIEDTKKTFGVSTIGVLNGVLDYGVYFSENKSAFLTFNFNNKSEVSELLKPTSSGLIQHIDINFSGIVVVDFSLYLYTGFKANSLVSITLLHTPQDGKIEQATFSTRTTMQNPEVHFVGSKILNVKPGDSLRFSVSSDSNDGYIASEVGDTPTKASTVSLLAIKTS